MKEFSMKVSMASQMSFPAFVTESSGLGLMESSYMVRPRRHRVRRMQSKTQTRWETVMITASRTMLCSYLL